MCEGSYELWISKKSWKTIPRGSNGISFPNRYVLSTCLLRTSIRLCVVMVSRYQSGTSYETGSISKKINSVCGPPKPIRIGRHRRRLIDCCRHNRVVADDSLNNVRTYRVLHACGVGEQKNLTELNRVKCLMNFASYS